MQTNDWGVPTGDKLYREIKEIQGSPEWKENRKKRLGGSEVASVLELSPYKSKRELWLEKTGRQEAEDISNLPYVRRGVEAEPVARKIVEVIQGIEYTTPVLVLKEHPWAAASLDGLATDHILEIKTMGEEKHQDVYLDGSVPDYYMPQLQWNMLIAGVDKALFVSYRPENWTLFHTWVKADAVFQRNAFAAAQEFWDSVLANDEPHDPFDDIMKEIGG